MSASVPRYSGEFIGEFRRLWADASLSRLELAQRFGKSPSALSHLADRCGLPKRAAYRAPRAIRTPLGVFPSSHAAGAAFGVSPNTACYRAARRINGWRYVGGK